MNKVVTSIVTRKATDAAKQAAEEITRLAEEQVVKTRKVYTLEIAVALLGGIVIGMFFSPRRNSSYTIASNNRNIGNSPEDDYDEEEDDFDFDDDGNDDGKNKSKFIKL